MGQLIFVVENDAEVADLSRSHLEQAGYSVRTFSHSDIIEEARNSRPVMFLIAMMMPDSNGVDLCRRIRETPLFAQTPVVFLLDNDTEEYRILALDSGGDDCIVKPISPRELVARVQAVLRRLVPSKHSLRTEAADLVIDSSAMKLSVRGSEI